MVDLINHNHVIFTVFDLSIVDNLVLLLIFHRKCDHLSHSLIERIRKNLIFTWEFYIGCKRFCSSDFHGISNLTLMIPENSTEYSRKCEYIVHLIRIIRSSRSDNTGSSCSGQLWHDLWNRIRHCKYDRVTRHSTYHIFCECSCSRYSEKYISSYHSICKCTSFIFEIREYEEFLF